VTSTSDPTTWTTCVNTTSNSCMFNLTLETSSSSGRGDTNSSPFYDYTPGSDTLYVGNDRGHLFKVTGVFSGAPALSSTNGFGACTGAAAGCLAVGTTSNQLTGPLLDSDNNQILIGGSDGNLYAVGPTNGT